MSEHLSTFSPLREALGRIGNPLPWEERRAIENALLDVAEAVQVARDFRFGIHDGVLSTDTEWNERTTLWDAVDAALARLEAQ